jgi:hypothetical protein
LKRALLLLVAVALLAGADFLAPPRSGRDGAAALGHPLVPVLGPLRPIVAELVRLRFDATRSADQVFGQLDDALSVLALRPDRIRDFVHFGWYFLLDVPVKLAGESERRAVVRAGLEILRRGQELHPRSAQPWFAEAFALDRIVRVDPRRLEGSSDLLGGPVAARMLEAYSAALARCGPPGEGERELVSLQFVPCVERILHDPATPPPVAVRARSAALELLAQPDLPAEAARALQDALRN